MVSFREYKALYEDVTLQPPNSTCICKTLGQATLTGTEMVQVTTLASSH